MHLEPRRSRHRFARSATPPAPAPRTTALHGPAALTPSTVELHVRNAYGKLGARNRHDLPALLEPTPG
jgi:hypothetical protein